MNTLTTTPASSSIVKHGTADDKSSSSSDIVSKDMAQSDPKNARPTSTTKEGDLFISSPKSEDNNSSNVMSLNTNVNTKSESEPEHLSVSIPQSHSDGLEKKDEFLTNTNINNSASPTVTFLPLQFPHQLSINTLRNDQREEDSGKPNKPSSFIDRIVLYSKMVGKCLGGMFAAAGAGGFVAVGYMDPGNWSTDLSAGSQFGYSLLTVVLISNLMAILLQSLW
jgi:hypothetical protein